MDETSHSANEPLGTTDLDQGPQLLGTKRAAEIAEIFSQVSARCVGDRRRFLWARRRFPDGGYGDGCGRGALQDRSVDLGAARGANSALPR